ncbi:MAG: acyltransferase family protein [Geminicoccaceae bacterium]
MTHSTTLAANHRLPAVSYKPGYGRVHSLDGLRAVSVLLVVLAHFGLDHVVPGGLGVTTFFFISGFIITRLLLAEIDQRGMIDLGAFYRRRFWRLWPAVVASIVGMLMMGALFGEVWAPLGDIVSALTFLQNYWGAVYPAQSPLGIHWSLAVEFHFYLLWPLVLLFLLVRPKLAVPVSAAALLAFLLFRVWLVMALDRSGVSWDVVELWTYQLSHLRADSLLFGCLLALLAFDKNWQRILTRIANQRSIWIGVAILLVTLIVRDDFFRVTIRYSIQGVALLLIFAGVLFAKRGGIARRLLNLPLMVWLGTISFSIYLWHKIMWRLVDQVAGFGDSISVGLMAGALTLVIAWLSYRYVELVFIRVGRKQWRAGPSKPAAGVSYGHKTL